MYFIGLFLNTCMTLDISISNGGREMGTNFVVWLENKKGTTLNRNNIYTFKVLIY